MKILNLHRRNTANVGDLKCAPYLYFPELLGGDAKEILGFRQADAPNTADRVAFKEAFSVADVVIIGGGGLLEIDFFEPALRFLNENKRDQKYVLWGAGHNSWGISDWRKLKKEYTFSPDLFDLVGVRDFGYDFTWVPCVSCMSSLFDHRYPTRRAIGLYVHSGTLQNPNLRRQLPADLQPLSNSAGFQEAIEYLATSELVLTDSFHGAYWALLLNRKVVAFPSSSKFYGLRHAVPLCSPEDWVRYAPLARVYDMALEECRQANKDFASSVTELVAKI